MSHYDRDANVAWLELEGFDGRRVLVEEHDWGLVERDSRTGSIVAVEFWQASTILPGGLLDALPEPASQARTVETHEAAG